MRKYIKLILEVFPIFIVTYLIFHYLLLPVTISGNSMYPYLKDDEISIMDAIHTGKNDIKRFDVVVLKYNGEKLIKRVIGLPGEHVEYKDGNLYIDGFLIEDTYGKTGTDDFKLETLGYLNIPGDMYFVVGDNRSNSADSRILGLIKKEDILGSVSYRIFPLTKIGRVK